MNKIIFYGILILIILLSGCAGTVKSEGKPIAKGYVNLCISDPAHAGYWQQNNDVIWNIPLDNANGSEERRSGEFPSCDNASVTIWEIKMNGVIAWDHVTLHAKNGRAIEWVDACRSCNRNVK